MPDKPDIFENAIPGGSLEGRLQVQINELQSDVMLLIARIEELEAEVQGLRGN